MASKYAPLESYLRELPSTQAEVALAFTQIEKILKKERTDICPVHSEDRSASGSPFLNPA